MRIIAACIFYFIAITAMAERLTVDKPDVEYKYNFNTQGKLHFCDLAAAISQEFMLFRLTAAFISDDLKPKGSDISLIYVVDAFVLLRTGATQIKINGGKIISDGFKSDLHASRGISKDLSVYYSIESDGSRALFNNLMTMRGAYTLIVGLENGINMTINVNLTADIVGESQKWLKCIAALRERRLPTSTQ